MLLGARPAGEADRESVEEALAAPRAGPAAVSLEQFRHQFDAATRGALKYVD